jgi:AmiR/NasT family two-component response regulator
MVERDPDPLKRAVNAADDELDRAWMSGADVESHLLRAKALSEAIGRDPVIEEAKVVLARKQNCTPSEAFATLREISQRTNRKLRDVAHEILEASGGKR